MFLKGKACSGSWRFLPLFPRQLHTQTHANTHVHAINILMWEISSLINETPASFCNSESLRQTSHRETHRRKTFSKLFTFVVNLDSMFWKLFASRSPESTLQCPCSNVLALVSLLFQPSSCKENETAWEAGLHMHVSVFPSRTKKLTKTVAFWSKEGYCSLGKPRKNRPAKLARLHLTLCTGKRLHLLCVSKWNSFQSK